MSLKPLMRLALLVVIATADAPLQAQTVNPPEPGDGTAPSGVQPGGPEPTR